MVLEGLKKFFGLNKFEEAPSHTMEIINEEIDEFEREIQEYIHYTQDKEEQDNSIAQPEVLAQGGGRAGSSFITPEEQKRIEGA